MPLILHPSRYDEAQAIETACFDAYTAVKEIVPTTFEELIRKQLENLGQIHSIPLPPLAWKIVADAGKEGLSIVEVPAKIKDSKNARAFRKWLSDIQMHLRRDQRPAISSIANIGRIETRYIALDVKPGHKRRRNA